MGKVALTVEVDAELLAELETAGLDPAEAARAGLLRAARSNLARRRRDDPDAAERRAREWADANREAIAKFNQQVAERGLLSDYEPFRPRWMR